MSTDGNGTLPEREHEWTPERLARIIAELRKRWVVRAMTSYALALWVTIQFCDITLQVLALPDRIMRHLVLIGLCGIPVSAAAGWWVGTRRCRAIARRTPPDEQPGAHLGALVLGTVATAACLLVLLVLVRIA